MLPSIGTETDHRLCQNVIGTSEKHSPDGSSATFLFLPHFDVICDQLLNRHMAAWNLSVKSLITDDIC